MVVVIGAPLVEELVVPRSAPALDVGRVGRRPRARHHLDLVRADASRRPVEWPGLFVAGALFGAGLALTGRIGAGILTHAAFNATGLILAFR